MSDDFNQLGLRLKQGGKDAQDALKRYAPKNPRTERILDIFDSVLPFEMSLKMGKNDTKVLMDLYFNQVSASLTQGCAEGVGDGITCSICETFTETDVFITEILLQMQRGYIPDSVTVFVDDVPTDSFEETSPTQGLVTVFGGSCDSEDVVILQDTFTRTIPADDGWGVSDNGVIWDPSNETSGAGASVNGNQGVLHVQAHDQGELRKQSIPFSSVNPATTYIKGLTVRFSSVPNDLLPDYSRNDANIFFTPFGGLAWTRGGLDIPLDPFFRWWFYSNIIIKIPTTLDNNPETNPVDILFQNIGDLWSVKIWRTGTPEPVDWDAYLVGDIGFTKFGFTDSAESGTITDLSIDELSIVNCARVPLLGLYSCGNDDFNRPDQAGWGSAGNSTWTDSSPTIFSIDSGRGLIEVASTIETVYTNTKAINAKIDTVTVDFQSEEEQVEQGPTMGGERITFGGPDMVIDVSIERGTDLEVTLRTTTGSTSKSEPAHDLGFDPSQIHRVKINDDGTTVRVKVWNNLIDSEPVDWLLERAHTPWGNATSVEISMFESWEAGFHRRVWVDNLDICVGDQAESKIKVCYLYEV